MSTGIMTIFLAFVTKSARLSQCDDLGNSVVTLYVYLYTELENVGVNWFEFAHYIQWC